MIPTHNSTLVKRLAVGAVARGDTVLVLGDPRPDYTMLAEHLGGQVIRVGRGLDRINPLDAGPLGAVLPRLPAAEAGQLRAEIRARRLSLLMALCTLIRGRPLGNAEEVILGRAVDLLDDRAERRPARRPGRPAAHRGGPRTSSAPPPAPATRASTATRSPTWLSPWTCCCPAR